MQPRQEGQGGKLLPSALLDNHAAPTRVTTTHPGPLLFTGTSIAQNRLREVVFDSIGFS